MWHVVICLKYLHYHQVGINGGIEFEEVIVVFDGSGNPLLNMTSAPGGKVTWKGPIFSCLIVRTVT